MNQIPLVQFNYLPFLGEYTQKSRPNLTIFIITIFDFIPKLNYELAKIYYNNIKSFTLLSQSLAGTFRYSLTLTKA